MPEKRENCLEWHKNYSVSLSVNKVKRFIETPHGMRKRLLTISTLDNGIQFFAMYSFIIIRIHSTHTHTVYYTFGESKAILELSMLTNL